MQEKKQWFFEKKLAFCWAPLAPDTGVSVKANSGKRMSLDLLLSLDSEIPIERGQTLEDELRG